MTGGLGRRCARKRTTFTGLVMLGALYAYVCRIRTLAPRWHRPVRGEPRGGRQELQVFGNQNACRARIKPPRFAAERFRNYGVRE